MYGKPFKGSVLWKAYLRVPITGYVLFKNTRGCCSPSVGVTPASNFSGARNFIPRIQPSKRFPLHDVGFLTLTSYDASELSPGGTSSGFSLMNCSMFFCAMRRSSRSTALFLTTNVLNESQSCV